MPDLAPQFFVGIDPALESFAASLLRRPNDPDLVTAEFSNELDGFDTLSPLLDELRLWQPKETLIEQIRTLLAAREQFVSQLGANRNMRHVLKKKVVQTPKAIEAVEETINYLKEQIKAIEEEIRRLLRSDPTLSEMFTLLLSIPSVGLLLSAHLMVVTDGFTREVTARELAAFIGICPYEHKSGKTVQQPLRSRGYGPPVLRKLMYMASLNLKKNSAKYQQYYARKIMRARKRRASRGG